MKKILIVNDENFEANIAGAVPSFSLLKIGPDSYLYDDEVFDVCEVIDFEKLTGHSSIAMAYYSQVESIRWQYDRKSDQTIYWLDDGEDGRKLLDWHWGEPQDLIAYKELFDAATTQK